MPSFTWPFPLWCGPCWASTLPSKALFQDPFLWESFAPEPSSLQSKFQCNHSEIESPPPCCFSPASELYTGCALCHLIDIRSSFRHLRQTLCQSSFQIPPDLLSRSPDKVFASFLVNLCFHPYSVMSSLEARHALPVTRVWRVADA